MKWGMELVTGDAPGLADVAKAIDRINHEMATIMGVDELLTGTTGTGSFALSKNKSTNLYLMANSMLRDERLQVDHDLLWPLWSLNGFDDKLMPKCKTEDVSPKDIDQISTVLRNMATAGSTIQPNDEIINWFRDLIGAPHVDLDQMAMDFNRLPDVSSTGHDILQDAKQEDKEDKVSEQDEPDDMRVGKMRKVRINGQRSGREKAKSLLEPQAEDRLSVRTRQRIRKRGMINGSGAVTEV
jgi:hypothetical protein